VAAIHRWAATNGVPICHFAKGDNKEKIAEPLLRAAAEEGGDGKVVLIGIAQEKASAWRSWKKKGPQGTSLAYAHPASAANMPTGLLPIATTSNSVSECNPCFTSWV
jgi:hypothetical protein